MKGASEQGPSWSSDHGIRLSAFPPIGVYAFLSDCATTALVAPNGNVEWLCLPRMDSPSVFAAILDRDAGGFRLGPADVNVPAARRYIPGTMVLETSWETRMGWVIVRDALIERIRAGVPFLGICLGLQGLFESSEEAPEQHGLGLFQGQIRRFPADSRVPHMGWNEIQPRNGSRLLRNLAPNPYLYFAHSYYAPVIGATAATCEYSVEYTAVLETNNVFGVQFHPEKSGPVGLGIVRNFVEL